MSVPVIVLLTGLGEKSELDNSVSVTELEMRVVVVGVSVVPIHHAVHPSGHTAGLKVKWLAGAGLRHATYRGSDVLGRRKVSDDGVLVPWSGPLWTLTDVVRNEEGEQLLGCGNGVVNAMVRFGGVYYRGCCC